MEPLESIIAIANGAAAGFCFANNDYHNIAFFPATVAVGMVLVDFLVKYVESKQKKEREEQQAKWQSLVPYADYF